MDKEILPGKLKDGEDPVTAQSSTTAMGYTPKHAKPVSLKNATLSGRMSSAVNAPSVGRHAAPESTARRETDTDSRRSREAKTPTAA
jgi:hypothetical protein